MTGPTEQGDTDRDRTDDQDGATEGESERHQRTSLPLRKRKEFWIWFVAILMAVVVAASFAIPLPYFVDGPGTVKATEGRIRIDGRESFDRDGTIAYTTVSQRQATPALIVEAWLDEAIDIIPRDKALGGRSPKQERAINQQLMDDSKVVAVVVAARAVGLTADFSGSGAFIDALIPGMPAEKVLEQGEVIVKIDDSPISVTSDITTALEGRPVGAPVSVTLRGRSVDRRERIVEMALGRNPDDASRGYLGVSVSTADLAVDLPFDIDLDSGQVIGPSAGLAWTLGVVDRLTKGELDGGRRVVVTGTIDIEGHVGPIGGLPQKVAAAKEFGAELFLYPNESPAVDVKRMKQIAGNDLEVRPVDTVADALRILAPDGVPKARPAT